MNELTFDVGLAAKLKRALIRNKIGDLADVDWLCEGNNLASVRLLRQGHAHLSVPEHLIDLDTDPFNPWEKNGWTVDEHHKGGTFKWNTSQIEFYLASGQKNGKAIEGNKLRKELASKPVFNANVLDYLLKNPHLIPEEWKKDGEGNIRYIFFWGTIYRSGDGRLYVRCLHYWGDDSWCWGRYWLGDNWRSYNPSALRAS